jgi:hypothetical protein
MKESVFYFTDKPTIGAPTIYEVRGDVCFGEAFKLVSALSVGMVQRRDHVKDVDVVITMKEVG